MKFSDLVNIDELEELCEHFTSLTGMVTAILDLDGNTLAATGWQDICSHFHRVNPITASRCRESDTVLAGKLKPGEKVNIYKCKNGLIDVAFPIEVQGEHVANFFTGQFFLEPPEEDFFAKQAEDFGFNKDSYIEALHKVPVISSNKLESIIGFLSHLGRFFGEMGAARREVEKSNITLQKEVRRASESQRYVRSLLDTIPDLIWLKDKDGVYLSCNKEFERFFGAKESDITGKTDYDFVDKELADSFRKHDRNAIAAEKPTSNEEWITFASDGRRALLYTTKTPMYDDNDSFVGVLGIGRDITPIRNAENELEKNIKRFEDIAFSIGEWIWEVDINGVYTFSSDKSVDVIGYRPDEILGKTCFDFMTEKQAKEARRFVENTFSTGRPFRNYENWNYHKKGHKVLLSTSGVPVKDVNGAVIGYRGVDTDVTDRHRFQAQAIRTSQLVSLGELSAGVAHEINNPIGGVINYADILKKKINDASHKDILNRIIYEGERIAEIVSNLLLFSRDEKNKFERHSIHKLIREPVSLIKIQLEKDGISVEENIEDDFLFLECSGSQIEQVLINLLSNARYSLNEKFNTKDGEKKIIISAEQIEKNEKKWASITVEDNGAGISDDDMSRIFDTFYTTKGAGYGTGLGLSISENILNLHGGTIHMESELGMFARAVIQLPIERKKM